ncbi:MAG: hypothetical protein WBE79_13405 [Candidatus Cybelea sp.]
MSYFLAISKNVSKIENHRPSIQEFFFGHVFEEQTFREKTGAIEIFAGALVTNKC